MKRRNRTEVEIYELRHIVYFNYCPYKREDFPFSSFCEVTNTTKKLNLKTPECVLYYVPIEIKLKIHDYGEKSMKIRYMLVDSPKYVNLVFERTAREMGLDQKQLRKCFYGVDNFELGSFHNFVVVFSGFFFEIYKKRRIFNNLYKMLSVISKHGMSIREEILKTSSGPQGPNCLMIGQTMNGRNIEFKQLDQSIENFKSNPLIQIFNNELRKIFAQKWNPIKDNLVLATQAGPLAINIISIVATGGTNAIGWIGLISDVITVIPILLKKFMHLLRKRLKVAQRLGFSKEWITKTMRQLFQKLFEFGGFGLDKVTSLFKEKVLMNENLVKRIGPKKIKQANDILEKIEIFNYYVVSGELIEILQIEKITGELVSGV